MSMHKLVMVITFLAVFAMAARVSVDTDTWWHLRTGQWIIENRSIPQTDPFSYTRLGESWQHPGWLVQVPMYWLFQMRWTGGFEPVDGGHGHPGFRLCLEHAERGTFLARLCHHPGGDGRCGLLGGAPCTW